MQKYIMMGTNKSIEPRILYYNRKEEPTEKNILSCISNSRYIGKFNVSECEPYDGKQKMFFYGDACMHILEEGEGMLFVWQLVGRLKDFNGVFVPDTYVVRRVALLVND